MATQTETLDHILAIVDGQVIMSSDVRAFVDLRLVDVPAGSDPEALVLDVLIERRVILDQVDRFAVAEPSAETVDRRLAAVQQGLPDDEALEGVLARVGLSRDDLRQLLADEIRREVFVAGRFEVVEESRRSAARSEWVAGLIRRAQVRRVREPGPATR